MTTATEQKPRTWKKKIIRTGPNGSFTGWVFIHFGIRLEPNPKPNVHNPGQFFRPVHVVKGNAEELTYSSPEFYFKEDAFAEARKIEILVTTALEKMSREPQTDENPIERNLKTLGYE